MSSKPCALCVSHVQTSEQVIPLRNWNCAFCVNHVQASETSLYESCSSNLTSICTHMLFPINLSGRSVLLPYTVDSSVCEIKIKI
jgi:hypothetical protein